jgi:hypothetical protein
MNFKNNKYLDAFRPSNNPVEIKAKRKIRIRVVLIILGIYVLGNFSYLGYRAFINGTDLTFKPLPEHNNLFIKEMQGELQKPFVYKSKVREAESNYNLPDDFHLTVSKLDLRSDKSLSQILKLQGNPIRSYEPYGSYDEDSILKMTRTTDEVDVVSIVNLRFQGSLLKRIIKNDTLACYYLKFKKFSISYDENSDNDIWGESEGANNAVISLAFIKKKKFLYVIILFKNKNEDRDFQPDLLYSYIRK